MIMHRLCSDDQVEKNGFSLSQSQLWDSPKCIVYDGNTDGPTKQKVEHLHELDKAEDDDFVC